MTNRCEPQGCWDRRYFKIVTALTAGVALLCLQSCASPDAPLRDPPADSSQVQGPEFSLVSNLADLANDPGLRAAGAAVEPNMTFVYKGQHFAKAPDGSIKFLMRLPKSDSGGLESLAPKFKPMTLEERLKSDPDYLQHIRDRVSTSDAPRGEGHAPVALELLETKAAALTSTITLTAVSPSSIVSVAGGMSTLTITGSGFGTDKTKVSIALGSQTCHVVQMTNTAIACNVTTSTAITGTVNVTVTVGSASQTLTNALTFTSSSTAPSFTLTSCTPSSLVSVAGGTSSVMINGNGFGTDKTKVSVSFGSLGCTIAAMSNTQIVCNVTTPTAISGAMTLTVTVGSMTATLANALTYTTPPPLAATGVTPATVVSVAGGTSSVMISGTGFGTDKTKVSIWFGSLGCPIAAISNTQIVCNITTPAAMTGSANLTITVGSATATLANALTFVATAPLGPEWLVSGQPNPVDLYVKNGTDYTAYSLSEWQTPVRNQLDRGTCWVFSSTGLLEAAYRHHLGLSLDLSEQFAKHIIYSTLGPVSYLAHSDNASSFWEGGNFTFTYGSALMNNTIPEESYAPYLSLEQMAALITANNCGDMSPANATQAQIDSCEYQESYISMAARRQAFYGFTNATYLGAADVQNPQTLESFIVGGHEIAVDLNLFWSASTADPTILDYDPTAGGGAHSMLFVGFDRRDPDPNRHYFIVKNSWGGDSLIKVSYKFVQNATSYGLVANSVAAPATGSPPYRSLWIGQWLMDNDGVQANVTIRRTDEWQSDTVGVGPEGVNTAATRLGQYLVPGGSTHELNGKLSDADRGMTAYLDTTVTTNAPGTISGRKIQTWLYESDLSKASGYSAALVHGPVHGAFLSRAPVAHPGAGSAFGITNWQGNWLLDFDGTLRTLTLGAVTNGTAIGTLVNTVTQAQSSVSLSVNNNTPWTGTFTVGGQAFTLYGMSTESGFIAGDVTTGGKFYGAHAIRQ